MKKEILKALRKEDDGFISGQSLCEKMGVTRQAVWKNISQLKEKGYEIESISNKGYRLVSSPDILYGADIESRMSEDCICQKVECFETIDSTNTQAKRFAEEGEPEGTLIAADQQTAGKGRRGRRWDSEPGESVYMSLILRPRIEPYSVSGITLIAAMAVAESINRICDVETQIKWPNDIVLGKNKICGILTEMSSELNYINYIVVGIGINVNTKSFPDEIEDVASSLYLKTGRKTDRAALIVEIMELFGKYYKTFIKEGNLSSFVKKYDSMLANKDKQVRILHGMSENVKPEDIETGIAKGIDKDGALVVETDEGTKSVVSGEVSVRGLYGYV